MDRAAIRRTNYPAMGGINKSLKAKPTNSGTGKKKKKKKIIIVTNTNELDLSVSFWLVCMEALSLFC